MDPITAEVRQAPEQGVLFELEQFCASTIGTVEARKAELKEAKEILEERLMEDEEYKKLKESSDAIKKELREKKEHLLEQGEIAGLQANVDEQREEVKDAQESLSGALEEYFKKSDGKNTIKDNTGVERTIKKSFTV